jgi:hypothetical protein
MQKIKEEDTRKKEKEKQEMLETLSKEYAERLKEHERQEKEKKKEREWNFKAQEWDDGERYNCW